MAIARVSGVAILAWLPGAGVGAITNSVFVALEEDAGLPGTQEIELDI